MIIKKPPLSLVILYNKTKKIIKNFIKLPPSGQSIAREIFASQQAELTAQSAESLIETFQYRPMISVVMPVYNTPVKWLRRAVESLQEQYYTNWELCVVDDCSPGSEQRQLLKSMAEKDPRIRFACMAENSGISSASNVAIYMSKGEFIALVDHDDELTPDALLRMVEAINCSRDADFLYSDECKIDEAPVPQLFQFILKPDWSPEIMFNCMLTGHLTLYRTSLVKNIGGFRSEYDFSQDYDLALRMAEVSRRIVHVERILYLWRAIDGSAASDGKDYARESNIAALSDALIRRRIKGFVFPLPHANRVRVDIPPENSFVSIVIPSDSVESIRSCLDGIRAKTRYKRYEICVVCRTSVVRELEDEYRLWNRLRFIPYDRKFNFSDKCNEGARAAKGDIVIFYNDDVSPISEDWIERLIEYLWVPGVGGVSPQLLYPDGNIQYAGMIAGTPGLVGTAYNQLPHDNIDIFLSMNRYVRNVSILSGACVAMRRELFFDLGGFDHSNTPDAHSDVDLSFRILKSGYRCVYTPYSVLYHIGNHSWHVPEIKNKADIFCLKRWGKQISRDPNFTNSMKRTLYRDFRFNFQIFAEGNDPDHDYRGPDVLFISHELSNTGAPRAVLEAAKALKRAGGFPVVISPTDGPLREQLIKDNITVIVDASIAYKHFLFERFVRNFDVVVVNTVVMRGVIEHLIEVKSLRIVWWIHEAQMLAQKLSSISQKVLDRVLIVCVSAYAAKFLPTSAKYKIVYNGLPAMRQNVETLIKDEKFVFLLLGTIEPRKGQDIFIKAIKALPESVRTRCSFLIAGKVWETNRKYWTHINTNSDLPEVVYKGSVTNDEALSLISQSDVLVVPSRDEPFSFVAIEAARFEKPTILSDQVGSCEVFGPACSFLFTSEDHLALRDAMIEAYSDRTRLLEMGRAARVIFEEQLTDQAFGKRFLSILDVSQSCDSVAAEASSPPSTAAR